MSSYRKLEICTLNYQKILARTRMFSFITICFYKKRKCCVLEQRLFTFTTEDYVVNFLDLSQGLGQIDAALYKLLFRYFNDSS